MEITFLGAAGTVTGSKYLLRSERANVLIDCGMFQGLKEFRVLNWDVLPVDIAHIDAVILTHAHLDHCGYLPRLVKSGFQGPIYGTEATIELAKVVLLDAAKIQEEDAAHANKHGFSKHHPALPLYDSTDVEATFPLFKHQPFHTKFALKDLEFYFSEAGHILGAASVMVSYRKTSILFSGDIGRKQDPIMRPPELPRACDYIVMESTYGDRPHRGPASKEVLRDLVNKIHQRKSILLIPAFAIGRSQNLLIELIELRHSGQIPKEIPIYLNTPMGQEVTRLYRTYASLLKVSSQKIEELFKEVHFIKSADESRSLNEKSGPMIIIAASGMLSGGRILYHLEAFGDNKNNIILLAGFQSAGTRGWALANGCTEVKIHGRFTQINAEVITSDSFSAHADQKELLEWVKAARQRPEKVFLVHGEPSAASELGHRIINQIGFSVYIPKMNERVKLEKMKAVTFAEPPSYDPQI
ncbi:MBL fold metallo-hydrolase RNA specificity domain-containing protein [Bdellovibrio svalbardensis]|uniref:MBL fold metallo-hydrolase n=1 Tax=Bdellovibrio svalbardensis TaxID=2972972 RepID=A0ABT6DMN9_9BACT|nr:MBL fold metallo-hydrolase [Bdellovibrio svalbardensis]MDG0818137.1 MBL fold metallo-hydrolase [Bdellovibrio svalbardensis]